MQPQLRNGQFDRPYPRVHNEHLMPIITLTSDFGLRDGYVGAMKGVICSIAPDARIVDVAHLIPPQDVVHGAFALAHAAPFFPVGTIHVGVVDPGVGTARAPICVVCDGQYFVGPDNGLFAICAHEAKTWEVYQLTNAAFFRPEVSPTFHGRDIFAPVGAHLARGVRPAQLGPRLDKPRPLELPLLAEEDGVLYGEVVYIDSFGNAVTNISQPHLAALAHRAPHITVGNATIHGISRTYADRAPQSPLALMGSGGLLEIAVCCGHAATQLALTRGSAVTLRAA